MIRIFDTGGRWFMACTNLHKGLSLPQPVAFPLDDVEGFYREPTGAPNCGINWINPAKEPTYLAESFDEVIDAIAAYDASKS